MFDKVNLSLSNQLHCMSIYDTHQHPLFPIKLPIHPSPPLPPTSTTINRFHCFETVSQQNQLSKTNKDKKHNFHLSMNRKTTTQHHISSLNPPFLFSLHVFQYHAPILPFAHPSFSFTSSHFLNTDMSLPNHRFSSSEH